MARITPMGVFRLLAADDTHATAAMEACVVSPTEPSELERTLISKAFAAEGIFQIQRAHAEARRQCGLV